MKDSIGSIEILKEALVNIQYWLTSKNEGQFHCGEAHAAGVKAAEAGATHSNQR